MFPLERSRSLKWSSLHRDLEGDIRKWDCGRGKDIYMHMFYLSHLDFPTSYCPIAQDPASFLLYVLSSKCEHIVADIDTEFNRIFPVQSRKLAISGILIIKFEGPFAR